MFAIEKKKKNTRCIKRGFSKNKISGTKNFSSLVTEDRVLYFMHLVRTTTLVNDRFCPRRELNEIGIFFFCDQRNRTFRKFENQAYYMILYMSHWIQFFNVFQNFSINNLYYWNISVNNKILINKNYMVNNIDW